MYPFIEGLIVCTSVVGFCFFLLESVCDLSMLLYDVNHHTFLLTNTQYNNIFCGKKKMSSYIENFMLNNAI